MKAKKRYRLILEDESHLQTVASRRFKPWQFWLGLVILFLVFLLISGMILSLTPLRTLLPGYMKGEQRSETVESMLRLDSLESSYAANQAFIDNYFKVLDTNRTPTDSASIAPTDHELTADSLQGAGVREKQFVSQMEERERFNISVLAPLAADGLMFSPVASDGIYSEEGKLSEAPIVLLPNESGIRSVADGSVIALYYSPAERGYVIVVQHARGFVSSYTHVGTPLTSVGDAVQSGQMVALAPKPDSKGRRYITVRMWHNGVAVTPYTYIGEQTELSNSGPAYEAPRGK